MPSHETEIVRNLHPLLLDNGMNQYLRSREEFFSPIRSMRCLTTKPIKSNESLIDADTSCANITRDGSIANASLDVVLQTLVVGCSAAAIV